LPSVGCDTVELPENHEVAKQKKEVRTDIRFHQISLSAHRMLAASKICSKNSELERRKCRGLYRTCVEKRMADALAVWKNAGGHPTSYQENKKTNEKEKSTLMQQFSSLERSSELLTYEGFDGFVKKLGGIPEI
jgi:hypothetical protein